ncbi:MAG: hypothetical protein ACI8P9_001040 [Parasphingorhabdus sp.]|jgi:hypothetical protein
MKYGTSAVRFLIFLLVLTTQTALACSCFELPTLEENARTYDQIVVVELKKSRNLLLKKIYKVNIKEVLKGEGDARLKSLSQGRTSCDPTLENKQQWLVFYNNNSPEFKPGWCNPHQVIEHLGTGTPDWIERIRSNS